MEKLSPQKRIRIEEWTTTGRQGREREREQESVCVCEKKENRDKQKRGKKKGLTEEPLKTLRVVLSLSFPRAVSRVVAIQTGASYLTPFIKSMTKATRCIKGK